MYTPTEEAIKRIMADTGMDYMQAVYHLRGRHHLQADTVRRTFLSRTFLSRTFLSRTAPALRYTLRLRADGSHLCTLADTKAAREMIEPCAGYAAGVYVETMGGTPRAVLAFDTEGHPLIRGSNGTVCRYV